MFGNQCFDSLRIVAVLLLPLGVHCVMLGNTLFVWGIFQHT